MLVAFGTEKSGSLLKGPQDKPINIYSVLNVRNAGEGDNICFSITLLSIIIALFQPEGN